jgi:Bacterial SH3 domain
MTMGKFLRIWLFVLFLSLFAAAQTAAVKRNVNLRPDPSTDNDPITTLTPPAQLNLIEPEPTDGFFHVKTSDGQEGWVWGRNIRVKTGSTTPASAEHIGPASLYPDPTMTPGLADTLDVSDLTRRYTEGCPRGKKSCTYSQAHRKVPARVHKAVYDEYSVPADARNIQHGEVNHFYPLCAGGSNDIKNLCISRRRTSGPARTSASTKRTSWRRIYAFRSRLEKWSQRMPSTGSKRTG